jgi:oligopeptide/dipeptide ABC transporter ATP-binding protein
LNEPAIEVRRLGVEFRNGRRSVKALDGIDLDVQRGQISCLVGESGSGKTTLGRVIGGLIPATSGTVRVDGELVDAKKRGELRSLWRKVQLIFQDPYSSLPPLSQVKEILRLPLVKYGIAKDQEDIRPAIEGALLEVGLAYEEVAGKYPRHLSGGQRQRVSIARTLLVQPEIIVADEPTSMLDVSLRIGVLDLLKDLNRKRNLTLVFITHDLGAAGYLGGRTAVMYRGQILEEAETADLLGNPLNPYTQTLLDAMPKIASDAWLRKDELPSREVEEGFHGCAFYSRCPLAQPVCTRARPELRSQRSGEEEGRDHKVACYLADAAKPPETHIARTRDLNAASPKRAHHV